MSKRNYKRCFKITYLFVSLLLYSILVSFSILLDKNKGYTISHKISNNNLTESTVRANYSILDSTFPLKWSTKLVFIWQGVWLIYAFVYTLKSLSNGMLPNHSNEIDMIPDQLLIWFSFGIVSLILWLLLQYSGFIQYSLLALLSAQLSVYISIFIASRIMYKLTDTIESSYNNLKVDVYLNKALVHNGLAALATCLTINSALNSSIQILKDSLSLDAELADRVLLGFILFLLIVYAYVENFVLQKYLLYTFSPCILITYELNSNLTANLKQIKTFQSLTFQQLSFNQNLNILVGVVSVSLIALKLIMFTLYKTTRRHQLDKSQSHKILQHKQAKLLAFLQRHHQEKYNQFDSIHYFKI